MQELHEAGSIGETFADAFYKGRKEVGFIGIRHGNRERGCADLHQSEYLIKAKSNPHPAKCTIVKSDMELATISYHSIHQPYLVYRSNFRNVFRTDPLLPGQS